MVEKLLKNAPVSGQILVWFWPSFDRSRFGSFRALDDDALDESIRHHEHSSEEIPRLVLQAVEAISNLSNYVQRALEPNLGDEDRSRLGRLDLKRFNEVVG